MPVAAQRGAFGWVGQIAQDDLPAAGEYTADGMTWHKALAGDLGLMDDQQPFALEVGGSVLIPGTFKTTYFSGGRLTLQPRLLIDDTLPSNGLLPLLWSFAGGAALFDSTESITTDTLPASVMGTATTIADLIGFAGQALIFPGSDGANIDFGFDRGDGDRKWLTARRLTPTQTGYMGETFYNTRVANMVLSAQTGAPVTLEVTFQGGAGDSNTYDQYVLESITGEPTPNQGWDYATAYPVDTVPIPTGGYVKTGVLSGAENNTVRNLQINFGGNMTRPQDVTVIGAYAPIDYSILSRSITITYEFLWNNADLYRQIKTGSDSGTAWSPVPFTGPFWTRFPDPANNWALGFFAQNVHWMSQPVSLRAETQVLMQVQGIVSDTAAGARWGLWFGAKDTGTPPTTLDVAAVWPT